MASIVFDDDWVDMRIVVSDAWDASMASNCRPVSNTSLIGWPFGVGSSTRRSSSIGVDKMTISMSLSFSSSLLNSHFSPFARRRDI